MIIELDDEEGFPTDDFDTNDMAGETPEQIAAALTVAAKMHAELEGPASASSALNNSPSNGPIAEPSSSCGSTPTSG